MISNKTISACMIVKNEETLLPKCLSSIKDIVDEIIIVDTGSNDKSIEVSKKFGAKVFYHPWENDFSKHRNQSISYATGDWILILDADEELAPSSGEMLQEAIENNDIDSIAVQVINYFNRGKSCAVFNSVRLFRNNGEIRYKDTVHNREVGCKSTRFYPIQVIHKGYNLNEDKMIEKFERTTSLLKEQIASDPQDPLPHHYLSASYLSMGVFNKEVYRSAIDESMLAIRLAKERGDNDQIYLCTHYIAAASYLNLGKASEAETVCGEALEIFPDHLDSYYLLAKIYDQKDDYYKARQCAKRYIDIRESIQRNPARFGKIINSSYQAEDRIKLILGKALHELGDEIGAKGIFSEIRGEGPEARALFRGIGEFYLKRGGFADAVHYFKEALKLEQDKLLLYMLLECYGQLWDMDNQIRTLSEIMDMFPEEINNIKEIGKVQFERCNYRLALFCLEESAKRGHDSPEIIQEIEKVRRIVNKQDPRGKRAKALPTISACLMVKDEEESIERCLKSIEPFVDEIVLIDTGSTDRTVEIALWFGAKVHHHPWEKDFSKHRNQSMSYATGDWILIIDADEVLDPEKASSMREIAGKTSKNALLFKGMNCSATGEVSSIFGTPRLFRNFMGCHYRGIVHNQAHYPGDPEPTPITIKHYGYDLGPEKMASKQKRTIELLEKQVRLNPNDLFPRFNLAISRFGAGDFGASAEEGERAITLIESKGIKDPGYSMIYYIVSMSHYNMNHLDEAENFALKGLDFNHENLDALFALTLICDRKDDHYRTIEYGTRYIDLHRVIDQMEVKGNIEYRSFGNRWKVLLCLSYAYHETDREHDALTRFEEACNEASPLAFPNDERLKFLASIGWEADRFAQGPG